MNAIRTLAMFLLLSCAPAWGQGCAMCKANAAASSQESQGALRRGIFVLLIPSLGAIGALGALVYRHRN